MIATNVANVIPLHLICLKYGLPYSAAEQFLGMNAIRNPSFVSGLVNLYAR